MKFYLKAISDANDCLRMEPENIKALIRKGQAFVGQAMLSEASDTFEKVLEIDNNNESALSEMNKIKPKLPPKNAFRMTIEEIDEEVPKKAVKKLVTNSEKLELPESSYVPTLVKNIVVEELSPFEKMMSKDTSKKTSNEHLVLPNDVSTKKPFIQEIC